MGTFTWPRTLIDALSSYCAVVAGEKLIGFCCIGEPARVPGVSEDPAILDVGLGMDPELVGCGDGAAFGRAVLGYLAERHPDGVLRAVVQSWNERSLRLTKRLGFEDVGELAIVQGGRSVSYRIVVRHRSRDRV
jgi:[ribosomal protein S18]-alanine N-acetyltransferase